MAKHQQQRATTFSVTVPTEVAQRIFGLVREGVHGSAGEVVRAALDRMFEAIDAGKAAADGAAAPPPRRGRPT
ncbi:MAG: hypothetical protein WAT39_03010 [Planctomycetota bacterium]